MSCGQPSRRGPRSGRGRGRSPGGLTAGPRRAGAGRAEAAASLPALPPRPPSARPSAPAARPAAGAWRGPFVRATGRPFVRVRGLAFLFPRARRARPWRGPVPGDPVTVSGSGQSPYFKSLLPRIAASRPGRADTGQPGPGRGSFRARETSTLWSPNGGTRPCGRARRGRACRRGPGSAGGATGGRRGCWWETGSQPGADSHSSRLRSGEKVISGTDFSFIARRQELPCFTQPPSSATTATPPSFSLLLLLITRSPLLEGPAVYRKEKPSDL